jgi:predicted nucleic acid-binding protein
VTGFLLDTNVISELRKGDKADRGVLDWFDRVDADELFLSVLVVGEIRRGIERIRRRDPISAQSLDGWLTRVRRDFGGRILGVDEDIAEIWGSLGLDQPVPPIDGLLAATALCHGLTLVTRNTKDLERTAVNIHNPFSGAR